MVAPRNSGSGSLYRLTTHALGSRTLSSGREVAAPVTFQAARSMLAPSRTLSHSFPGLENVSLRVFTTGDGMRRFFPTVEDGFAGLLERAVPFGLALLARERNLAPAAIDDYRTAKFAFDYLQRVQGIIKFRFESSDALVVHKHYRPHFGCLHLLPTYLGLSPTALERVGQAAAAEEGWGGAPSRRCHYGLNAAALTRPLFIPAHEVRPLLRLALYDLSNVADAVSCEQATIVRNTFRAYVLTRLELDPEDLRQRLSGGSSNFLRIIAGRKDASGTKLGRDVAKRGMHDFAWESHFLVAECLEAFAQAFAAALPSPLNEYERRYFEATFCRQDYLGGLPLAMIGRRGRVLQPTLEPLWERPGEPRLIGALHRVLQAFGEIVPRVREVERLKSQAPPTLVNVDGIDEQWILNLRTAATPAELFAEVLERRKLECDVCGSRLAGDLVVGSLRMNQSLRLETICEEHGPQGEIALSWAELNEAKATFIK
jgi:hypothetical protein